jgi:hypothetical protein
MILGIEQPAFAVTKDLATAQTDSLVSLLTKVTSNLSEPLQLVTLQNYWLSNVWFSYLEEGGQLGILST